MPVVYGIMFAIFTGASLLLLMLLPHPMQYIKMYFELLLWLTIWPALMAVYNFIVDLIIQYQASGYFTNYSGTLNGIAISNVHVVSNWVQSSLAWVGYLSWSIPMLSYAIVSGSAMAMTSMVGSMDAAVGGGVSAGASQVGKGDVSFGNTIARNMNVGDVSGYNRKWNTNRDDVLSADKFDSADVKTTGTESFNYNPASGAFAEALGITGAPGERITKGGQTTGSYSLGNAGAKRMYDSGQFTGSAEKELGKMVAGGEGGLLTYTASMDNGKPVFQNLDFTNGKNAAMMRNGKSENMLQQKDGGFIVENLTAAQAKAKGISGGSGTYDIFKTPNGQTVAVSGRGGQTYFGVLNAKTGKFVGTETGQIGGKKPILKTGQSGTYMLTKKGWTREKLHNRITNSSNVDTSGTNHKLYDNQYSVGMTPGILEGAMAYKGQGAGQFLSQGQENIANYVLSGKAGHGYKENLINQGIGAFAQVKNTSQTNAQDVKGQLQGFAMLENKLYAGTGISFGVKAGDELQVKAGTKGDFTISYGELNQMRIDEFKESAYNSKAVQGAQTFTQLKSALNQSFHKTMPIENQLVKAIDKKFKSMGIKKPAKPYNPDNIDLMDY